MDEATQKLFDAVIEYIEANGGEVFVIGGVFLERPQLIDFEHNYRLGIKFTGRPPVTQKGSDDDRLRNQDTAPPEW